MHTYQTWVRDPRTGVSYRVTVEASSADEARMKFEGQYGAANVIHPPTRA